MDFPETSNTMEYRIISEKLRSTSMQVWQHRSSVDVLHALGNFHVVVVNAMVIDPEHAEYQWSDNTIPPPRDESNPRDLCNVWLGG